MSLRLLRLVPALAVLAVTMALPPATASMSGAELAAATTEPPDHTEGRALRNAPRYVSVGERAAQIALEAVGTPYRWGGESPTSGFDCSGLVRWAYGRLGIDVPHSSYALWSTGQPVARTRVQAGDVLVFSGIGHVGLYLGRGRMVHAPHSGRTVEVVGLASTNYGSRLIGARRVTRA
jgi:cell wall-associated NlpC family hydrolase